MSDPVIFAPTVAAFSRYNFPYHSLKGAALKWKRADMGAVVAAADRTSPSPSPLPGISPGTDGQNVGNVRVPSHEERCRIVETVVRSHYLKHTQFVDAEIAAACCRSERLLSVLDAFRHGGGPYLRSKVERFSMIVDYVSVCMMQLLRYIRKYKARVFKTIKRFEVVFRVKCGTSVVELSAQSLIDSRRLAEARRVMRDMDSIRSQLRFLDVQTMDDTGKKCDRPDQTPMVRSKPRRSASRVTLSTELARRSAMFHAELSVGNDHPFGGSGSTKRHAGGTDRRGRGTMVSQFLRACIDGGVHAVSALLQEPRIYAAASVLNRGLRRAVPCGNVEVVNMLLARGAHVYDLATLSETVLHDAVNPHIMKALIRSSGSILPAVVAMRDVTGEMATHALARNGAHESLSILLDALDSTAKIIDARDDEGNTALHIAALSGCTCCATILLKHGASVELPNRELSTPLYFAIQLGARDMATLLLSAGSCVTLAGPNSYGALHLAVIAQSESIVEALLEHGPDSTLFGGPWPACFLAVETPAIFKRILRTEVDHQTLAYYVDRMKRGGFLPSFFRLKPQETCVGRTLAAVRTTKQRTLLHSCAMNDAEECVRYLIDEMEADVEALDRAGWSPHVHAFYNGHIATGRIIKASVIKGRALAGLPVNSRSEDIDVLAEHVRSALVAPEDAALLYMMVSADSYDDGEHGGDVSSQDEDGSDGVSSFLEEHEDDDYRESSYDVGDSGARVGRSRTSSTSKKSADESDGAGSPSGDAPAAKEQSLASLEGVNVDDKVAKLFEGGVGRLCKVPNIMDGTDDGEAYNPEHRIRFGVHVPLNLVPPNGCVCVVGQEPLLPGWAPSNAGEMKCIGDDGEYSAWYVDMVLAPTEANKKYFALDDKVSAPLSPQGTNCSVSMFEFKFVITSPARGVLFHWESFPKNRTVNVATLPCIPTKNARATPDWASLEILEPPVFGQLSRESSTFYHESGSVLLSATAVHVGVNGMKLRRSAVSDHTLSFPFFLTPSRLRRDGGGSTGGSAGDTGSATSVSSDGDADNGRDIHACGGVCNSSGLPPSCPSHQLGVSRGSQAASSVSPEGTPVVPAADRKVRERFGQSGMPHLIQDDRRDAIFFGEDLARAFVSSISIRAYARSVVGPDRTRFHTLDAPANMSSFYFQRLDDIDCLEFDLNVVTQANVLGRGYLLRDDILACNRGVRDVVLTSPRTGAVVGTLTVMHLVVLPEQFSIRSGSLREVYWKTSRLIGHRGGGADKAARTRGGQYRSHISENTVLSFTTAAMHQASFVEFDVHLTADRVPVIHHDYLLGDYRKGFQVPIGGITYVDLCKLMGVNPRSHDLLLSTALYTRENEMVSKMEEPQGVTPYWEAYSVVSKKTHATLPIPDDKEEKGDSGASPPSRDGILHLPASPVSKGVPSPKTVSPRRSLIDMYRAGAGGSPTNGQEDGDVVAEWMSRSLADVGYNADRRSLDDTNVRRLSMNWAAKIRGGGVGGCYIGTTRGDECFATSGRRVPFGRGPTSSRAHNALRQPSSGVRDSLPGSNDVTTVPINLVTGTSAGIKAEIATLTELLQLKEQVGFNIELKYPVNDIGIQDKGFLVPERNEYLSKILQVVFSMCESRQIFFSSFDPDVCLLLRQKQARFPVFLLTDSGTVHIHGDPRASSLRGAVNFAKKTSFDGYCGAHHATQ